MHVVSVGADVCASDSRAASGFPVVVEFPEAGFAVADGLPIQPSQFFHDVHGESIGTFRHHSAYRCGPATSTVQIGGKNRGMST